MTGMGWVRRTVLVVVCAAGAIALVAASLLTWSIRRAFPDHDGTANVAALEGPVEVLRDELGVPHIYADDPLDLYRAQGYVHAQDRFWQMDTWRHITAGRTAELFGPDQLGSDRFLRTLGWTRIAEAEYGMLGPDERAIFDAYAEGVNAYLDGRPTRRLGFAYTVLGLTNRGYEPEPWDPVHTLAFLKLMAWDLGGNMDSEIERAVLAQHLGDEQVVDLFPPYPADGPVMVHEPGTAGADHGDDARRPDDGDHHRHLGASDARRPDASDHLRNPGADDGAQHPDDGDHHRDAEVAGAGDYLRDPGAGDALARLAETLDDIDGLLGPRFDGVGSNSWVLAGDRTATGAPILANDPHLGIGMPSIWYEAGLHCRVVSDACPDHVAGFTFAGVPGVIIGHNDRVAWGFTNLGPDVQDLYLERVHPDDPYRYEVEGEWVDMEVVTETLRAADGTEETLEIRLTRNGPIISGRYGALDDIDGLDGYEVALRWTALEPGTTPRAITALNRARDWEAFRDAARLFEVPSQNLVYADVDGHIGYQAPGRMPIRTEAHDGLLPAPGWDDDYQWQGFIDFDELPWEADPARGWIVSANNAVVGDDYPYALSRQWAHGYRARRIESLVADGNGVDVSDASSDQLDEHDGSADFLVPALLGVDAGGDERVAEVQGLLDGWDRQMAVDSAPAAAYAATWRALLSGMFADLPERYRPAGNARWIEAVRLLLADPGSHWWGPGQEETLAAAMADGHDELSEALGGPDDWAWGRLHTATFAEGTLGASGIGPVEDRFNRGPYEVGGGSAIVNATGWNARDGYEVVAVPSMRMVVDLADLDRTRTVHTTGQSGHPYHRNYTDMTDLWVAGDQRTAAFTRPAVEAAAVSRLLLEP